MFHKDYCDHDYIGEKKYKLFYIVDTITINNPVIVYGKDNFYVTQKEVLLSQKKIDKYFYLRPDVFIFSFDYNSSIDGYDYKIHKKLKHCKTSDLEEFKNIYYRNFESNSLSFILGLINVNHFNIIFNAMDSKKYIDSKKQKIEYYKILFPLCE